MKNGWPTKSLAEVCEIRPPKSEARKRVDPEALVSFVPMEDLGIDRKVLTPTQAKPLASVEGSYTYFADGDVLLAKITPCFENGKLGIASGLTNGIGFGSSEFIVFRPPQGLDKEFLYYYLSRADFRIEGEARMGGAVGQQRVAKEFIESYRIPVPPLPEQRRIVGILDEAFEGIATAKANAEKNLQNARAIFESHLQSVFAEMWSSCELVALSDLATDITDGDHVPPPKSQAGVPLVTIGNINKETRTIDFTNTFMVPRNYFDRIKTHRKPSKGDVLYTVTGSFGIPVILENNFEFCFQRHIGLIRPKAEIQSAWLYYLLLSPQVFKQADERATGTAQKTVSLKVLRSFEVPRVTPHQQRAAVTVLDTLAEETQRLESIYKRKLVAIEALKKSLLHQAFNGELAASEKLQERVA
jgi:type I restriction enzyme S subunit